MLFEDTESEELFRRMMGDTSLTGDLEKLEEIYVASKGDYIRSISTFKRSMIQKHNWRKYRHLYKQGIHRFHRNPKTRTIRDSIMARIKAGVSKVKTKSEDLHPTLLISKDNYGKFELLQDLAGLKYQLARDGSTFELEELYVEKAMFLEKALESISEVEKGVLLGSPVGAEHFEILLAILGDEVLGDSALIPTSEGDDVAYVDLYIVSLQEVEHNGDHQTPSGTS